MKRSHYRFAVNKASLCFYNIAKLCLCSLILLVFNILRFFEHQFSRLIQMQLAIGVAIDARKNLFHGAHWVSAF